MKKLFWLLLMLSAPMGSCAAENAVVPNDKFGGLTQKNDINLLKATAHFDRHYKLVSARYRTDKKEIRMIYGNELAIQGLKNPSSYRKGAIFYKAVFDSSSDPSFEASIGPRRSPKLRQLMLFDPAKYKNSGGWGYAVFGRDNLTLPGDPEATTQTCFACHALVKERNYVFASPFVGLEPSSKVPKAEEFNPIETDKLSSRKSALFKFEDMPISKLDQELLKFIRLEDPPEMVNFMNGAIQKEGFTGYMAELSSFLLKRTRETKKPSFALKDVGNILVFSYAYIALSRDPRCSQDELTIHYGYGKFSKSLNHANNITSMISCESIQK